MSRPLALAALLCLCAAAARSDDAAPAPSTHEDHAGLKEALLGVHLCGEHWNDYKNYCEIVEEEGELRIKTLGDFSLLEGKLRILDDKRFVLEGRVRQIKKPWADFDAECGGSMAAGEYTFRQTGKRRYWRYVRTCPSMLTFYFDIFHKLTPREEALAKLAKWRPSPSPSPSTTKAPPPSSSSSSR